MRKHNDFSGVGGATFKFAIKLKATRLLHETTISPRLAGETCTFTVKMQPKRILHEKAQVFLRGRWRTDIIFILDILFSATLTYFSCSFSQLLYLQLLSATLATLLSPSLLSGSNYLSLSYATLSHSTLSHSIFCYSTLAILFSATLAKIFSATLAALSSATLATLLSATLASSKFHEQASKPSVSWETSSNSDVTSF